MEKYIITIDEIKDDGSRVPYEFCEGQREMTVRGFCIFGDVDDELGTGAIHNMSVEDIAKCISGQTPLMQAARCAILGSFLDRFLDEDSENQKGEGRSN